MLCCLADHLLFSALLPYLAFAGRGVFFLRAVERFACEARDPETKP